MMDISKTRCIANIENDPDCYLYRSYKLANCPQYPGQIKIYKTCDKDYMYTWNDYVKYLIVTDMHNTPFYIEQYCCGHN